MFWETLWALVLGFGISALVQVFVSKEQMANALGRSGLREVAFATIFGAASSSCSYAATSAARAAFSKGAALVPVLAFMFASTNLVFELGAVLWVFLGWTFVLAEVIGAFALIAIMWLIVRLTLPKGLADEARAHAQSIEEQSCHGSHERSCCGSNDDNHAMQPSQSRWASVASAFFMEWSMLWKELITGFLIAGFAMVLVPAEWWRGLFLTGGPAGLRLIENAIVGPIIAVGSFVCSVGNIPLASLLWSHGISFGGVISFIYADLIIVPLLLIYRKYYGLRAAAYISIVLFVSMVLSGIAVDLLFAGLGLIPDRAIAMGPMQHASFAWNYTTWLNIAAMVLVVALVYLRKTSKHNHSSHSGCC